MRQPPLGVLADGVTARAGTITADAMCTSPQRTTSSAVYYARRHSFELANRAVVTIDLEEAASISTTLDTYVLLFEGSGHGGTGTVLGRNDDRVSGETDSRIADKTLAPGRYTIEATTYAARRTGRYTLTVTAQLEVLIEGLDGAARVGTGTARDHFTVTPADANCTTSVGAVTAVGGTGRRTLAVELAALGDTTATVRCTRTGYTAAAADSTLNALDPVSDVNIRADSGGTCRPFPGTLDAGVDNKYTCTMTRGDTLAVTADATGPSAWLSLGWTDATGVAAAGGTQSFDSAIAAGSVRFTHTATAQVTCTADADVTLAVSRGGTTHHITVVSVTCMPPVQISNYVPGSRDGPGAMSGSFDVASASAGCTASHAGGIAGRPTAEGDGTRRTVPVSTAGTGWVDVEVECEATRYATTTATARFVARPDGACVSPLGRLSHGSRSVLGSLTATSCTTDSRPAGSSGTHYAHRYTFTMATSGQVSISLEPTGTGTDALDTYLQLLRGHGSDGAVLHSHNNLVGDATRLDDIYLAAGDYTVETTTALPNSTGGYRVTVEGDFAVQSDGLPLTVTATVDQTASASFDYRPIEATVTVQSVSPEGLEATVAGSGLRAALALTPDKARITTVTLAFTASGHTSTKTVTVTSYCQTGFRPSPDGTCQPLTPQLGTSCFQTISDGRTWGKRRGATVTLESLFGGACASVSISGKTAKYQAFDVLGSTTSRSSYDVTIELETTRDAQPYPAILGSVADRQVLPDLRVVLWQVDGGSRGSVVSLVPDASRDITRARYTASVHPGDYVVEVVPSYGSLLDIVGFGQVGDRFAVNVVLPSIQQNLDDVRFLGNIQLNGQGASLDAFLDARGTLRYGASPCNPTNDDDLFDPVSPGYPWLSFSVDRCSIPEGVVAAGDAIVDRIFAALLLDWRAVLSGDIEDSDLDELIQSEWFRDFPDFGGAEVGFVYGCMRHDFNWKNLDRVSWFHNHGLDATTSTEHLAGVSNQRVRCTAPGYVSGSDTADFVTDTVPDVVEITGFDGDSRSLAGLMSDDFDVSPSSASCSASRVSGISASFRWVVRSGVSRTLEVTTTGIGTVEVRVRCTAPGYVSGSATADFVTGGVPDRCSADLGTLGAGTVARSGQIAAVSECTSWQLGTAAAPHYARRFTLGVASPSSVTVAASSAVVDVYLYVLEGSGASAVVVGSDDDGGPGTDALVSGAALQPDRSYVVEVTTAAPRSVGAFSLSVAVTPDIETVGDVCNDPLGTLREGVTSRSGTIAADAACTSAQRRANPGSSVYYARRHTLSLSADATVTIDLADSATDAETLDPYLILLGGHNAGTGTVLHTDDDGGDTANDSRISAVALAAGAYTIEATSYGSRDHGDYSLEVAVDYVDLVEIMGLDDSTESGSGAVTVTDRFAVAPPDAACTAAPVGEIDPDPGGGAGGRVLSVEFAGPGTAAVTVTCTAAGRGSAQAEVEFVAEGSVAVSVSGDACSAASPVPAGADRAYRCVLSDEHRLTRVPATSRWGGPRGRA